MDIYDLLIKKIEDYIKKFYLNKIIKGVIYFATISFIIYLIAVNIEYFSYLPPFAKTIFIYSYLTIVLILFYQLILKYLLFYYKIGNKINYTEASQLIGLHFPEIKDKLLNTLQLKAQSNSLNDNSLLLESINQKIIELNPIPFTNAINLKHNLPFLKYLGIALFVFLGLYIIKPSLIEDGTERILLYDKQYIKPAPFNFTIENKNLTVLEGENLTIKLKMEGNILPEEVFITYNNNNVKLFKIDNSTFEYTFNNLQKNTLFKFKSNEFYSKEFEISVIPKATIKKYLLKVSFPKYLNLSSKVFNNFNDLVLPEGAQILTQVDIAKSNSLEVTSNNKKIILTKNANQPFTYKQSLTSDIKNILSVNDIVLSEQKIECIKDKYPNIKFNADKDSLVSSVYYVRANINDDYGLNDVSLHYKILESNLQFRKGKHFKIKIPFKSIKGNASILYFWNLNASGIKNNEKIEYYLSATDNDGFNGPKTAYSDKNFITINFSEQNQKSVEKRFNLIEKEILNAKSAVKNLQEDAKKLNLSLVQKNSLDQETKESIASIIKKEEDLKKQLDELKKLAKDLTSVQKALGNKENLNLDQDKKLEKLTENIFDEKTKKLLDDLKQLMANNDVKSIKEKISKSPLENKLLEKELDRLLNLYKELSMTKHVNKISEDLKNLAKEQKSLSEKSMNKNLMDEQKSLERDFNNLKKEIENVKRKNLDEKYNKDLSALNDEKIDEIDKSLDKLMEDLLKNKPSTASSSQKKSAELMQKMSDQLSFSMSNEENNEIEIDEQQLKLLRKNLLNTSFEQEKLIENLKLIQADDPEFLNFAKNQKKIGSNLKTYQDNLFEISKSVPDLNASVNIEFENINRILQHIYTQFTERNNVELLKNEKLVLTSVNNLILTIDDVLEKLKNASKSGSMGKGKPSLKQISQMQQQLNDNMQQAKKQLEQQGSSKNQSSKSNGDSKIFSALAQRQQEIREALEKLDKSQKMEGLGGVEGAGNAIKQMEQTENDLVYKKITNEVLLRQKQIETKLLESEKAEQERENSPKKESEIPDNISPVFIKKWEEYKKIMNKDFEIYKTISPTLNQFYKEKLDLYYKNLNAK